MSRPRVVIQTHDFDLTTEVATLRDDDCYTGAVVAFVGTVRDSYGLPRERSAAPRDRIASMELEHYPGMTETAIESMIDNALLRFDIRGARVIHRVGLLQPIDQIMMVAVTASHRGQAFAACEFLMDYLKTQAPLWKKEHTLNGAQWVDARASDDDALRRWGQASTNAVN